MTVIASAGALALGPAAAALAESDTVQGSGDIKKLVASNRTHAVVAKVYGLAGPCEARDLEVFIASKQAGRYMAQAACNAGTTWAADLYYNRTGDVEQHPHPVSCDGFRMKHNDTGNFWRVVFPRTCITHAPDRVRLSAYGTNYGSATGGTAGPTRLLDRG
jgi:hypothetical protein